MWRALFLCTLLFLLSPPIAGQAPGVLHIKIVVVDADGKPMPVPHHALLISDNPATAAPRRVVTGPDGTADVQLRRGNYTIESDRPVNFNGKAYQWTRTIDIAAGRDAVLELTAANAEIGAVSASAASSGAPLEADPSFLLPRWQDSVVGVWTATTHASAFVIDTNGLLLTNKRGIRGAPVVEVQLTPVLKVAGSVLASDPAHDLAVLRIDPKLAASMRPVPLRCEQEPSSPVAPGQEIFTIAVPLREHKGMTSGVAGAVHAHSIESDMALASGGAGGPVFSANGDLVGVTSVEDEEDHGGREDALIVPSGDACSVIASAQKLMAAAPPSDALLPMEPARPFPADALKDAAEHRGGSLSPYQISVPSFDISFITPVLTYGAQHQAEQADRRDRERSPRAQGPERALVRPLMDFSNWSEYVGEFPPVLLVRVTPKMVEGFWTTVARGAARTQGVAIPPIKHFKSGFGRMRAYCGANEVTPIHPFKLEQRISETDAINEGLYVFDPDALGPQCGNVKLVLYSEKEPDKGETRSVDAAILEQIAKDFAPYRVRTP